MNADVQNSLCALSRKNSLRSGLILAPSFSDEETGAQRCKATCPRTGERRDREPGNLHAEASFNHCSALPLGVQTRAVVLSGDLPAPCSSLPRSPRDTHARVAFMSSSKTPLLSSVPMLLNLSAQMLPLILVFWSTARRPDLVALRKLPPLWEPQVSCPHTGRAKAR